MNFEQHDKLGLKPFSEKLERFLMVEHDFVDGSLVVSLNAPFGAGKSTFLSMWKADFDARRKSDPVVPKAIIINAWDNDYCGDPLLSIVSALIKAADGDGPKKTSEAADRLREAAKDVGWFVTGLANNFAAHWAGVDPAAAGKFAEDKQKARLPKTPDFISLYEGRSLALSKLKSTLKEVFGGEFPKAFLFVDELDRCRPDYAINYLETIKHVFDVHGLVFVLAVDLDQLECSAKALFGSDLNFADYFRKFAQRTISIPEPDEQSLRNLADHYILFYLEREGKRLSKLAIHGDLARNITELVHALKMPPRQVQEMFRIIGHTVAASQANQRGQIYWCIGLGVILLAALKVAELSMYMKIGRDETSPKEVGGFLIGLLGTKRAKWWFQVYLTGNRTRENREVSEYEAELKAIGLINTDSKFDAMRDLYQFESGWGSLQGAGWKEIFRRIEAVNAFI